MEDDAVQDRTTYAGIYMHHNCLSLPTCRTTSTTLPYDIVHRAVRHQGSTPTTYILQPIETRLPFSTAQTLRLYSHQPYAVASPKA
ncbi:MAG: hypothetical protein IJV22_06405 [Bacteroidales bacterium]|nr:hypothetical protein [Bacteroidales bacterium]